MRTAFFNYLTNEKLNFKNKELVGELQLNFVMGKTYSDIRIAGHKSLELPVNKPLPLI